MTKTEMFEKIKVQCADQADIVEFCDQMIEEHVGNVERYHQRVELMDKVEELLSSGAVMTNRELADACDVTWQKMSHITRALVTAGKLVKTEIKTVTADGKPKRATAFARA